MTDVTTARIDFEDLGLCEYGHHGGDAPQRDADACPNAATNITEEGYRWCADHARLFYATVAIFDGKDPPE